MDVYKWINECEKDMPQNLDELDKARFIYIWLGKKLQLNENYYLGEEKDKKDILIKSKKIANVKDYMKYIKDNRIICVTSNFLYSLFLYHFGIRSFSTSPDRKDPHVYLKIILNDGRMINADLQNDIHNIGFDLKTMKFGFDDADLGVSVISEDKIEKSDKRIHYPEDGKYKKYIFKQIRDKYIDKKIDEMKITKDVFKDILDDIKNSFNFDNKGIMEIQELYKIAITSIINWKEKYNIDFETFYFQKNGYKKYGQAIIYRGLDGKDVAFLYSDYKKGFAEIENEKLKEFIQNKGLIPNNARREFCGIRFKGNAKKVYPDIEI